VNCGVSEDADFRTPSGFPFEHDLRAKRLAFAPREDRFPPFRSIQGHAYVRGKLYLMDLRQYNVFGQPHGYCGWYKR
jgi:hypothetical protein